MEGIWEIYIHIHVHVILLIRFIFGIIASVGIIHLRTKGHGVCLFVLLSPQDIENVSLIII
jgi:hypothetical protein